MFPSRLFQVSALLASLQLAAACGCGSFEGTSAGIKEHLAKRSNTTVPVLKRIALDNVRYFNDHEITDPTTIIIDGASIGLIGSYNGSVDERIDCNGQFLIPGLFDAHTHPGSLDDMKNLTRFGVTTNIGASCQNLTLCNELKKLPGLSSFITAGIPAISPNSSNLATPDGVPEQSKVYNLGQVQQFVANAVGNGSELFKYRSQNGGFPQEMQNAIVAEAHKYGKFVMTHVTEYDSIERAITAGTDLIHHSISDGVLTDDMVQRILGQGIVNVPTLRVHYAGLQAGYLTEQNYTYCKTNVKKLYDAGVPLLAGTDAHHFTPGSLPELWFPFGDSLDEELDLLQDAGVSPLYILQAATSRPAEVFGFNDRGVIRSGMRSDLVLIEGNPLMNITNVRNIKKVWVAGEEYRDQ